MSNETLTMLNSRLYPNILVDPRADASRVNEIKEDIVKTEHGLARFMSRYIPKARNLVNKGTYYIKKLGKALGGQYNPVDDSLHINFDQPRSFREESVVHEKMHFYQKVGGALERYWNGLVRNLGILGAMLYRPIIEGGASYLTQLYRGKESQDAYEPYRVAAKEVAQKHGEGVLVNPPKNETKILKIANTFIKGLDKYLQRNPRRAYALA